MTFLPAHNQPFRWLPRNGQPSCIGEWMTQHVVRFFAWLPFYTAVIVSAILFIQLVHPFGLGK